MLKYISGVEAVRPPEDGFPFVVLADPAMPIADDAEPHLTINAEGLIASLDGTWVLELTLNLNCYLTMFFLATGSAMNTVLTYIITWKMGP